LSRGLDILPTNATEPTRPKETRRMKYPRALVAAVVLAGLADVAWKLLG
jgi:hypothetical protein